MNVLTPSLPGLLGDEGIVQRSAESRQDFSAMRQKTRGTDTSTRRPVPVGHHPRTCLAAWPMRRERRISTPNVKRPKPATRAPRFPRTVRGGEMRVHRVDLSRRKDENIAGIVSGWPRPARQHSCEREHPLIHAVPSQRGCASPPDAMTRSTTTRRVIGVSPSSAGGSSPRTSYSSPGR